MQANSFFSKRIIACRLHRGRLYSASPWLRAPFIPFGIINYRA